MKTDHQMFFPMLIICTILIASCSPALPNQTTASETPVPVLSITPSILPPVITPTFKATPAPTAKAAKIKIAETIGFTEAQQNLLNSATIIRIKTEISEWLQNYWAEKIFKPGAVFKWEYIFDDQKNPKEAGVLLNADSKMVYLPYDLSGKTVEFSSNLTPEQVEKYAPTEIILKSDNFRLAWIAGGWAQVDTASGDIWYMNPENKTWYASNYAPEEIIDSTRAFEGLVIPMQFGIHSSVIHRKKRPMTIQVTPGAEFYLVRYFIDVAWQNYINNRPDEKNITRSEYVRKVTLGEGEVQLLARDAATHSERADVLTFDIRKGIQFVQLEGGVAPLKFQGADMGYEFVRGQDGRLIIYTDIFRSTDSQPDKLISDLKTFQPEVNIDQNYIELNLGVLYSGKIAVLMEFLAYTPAQRELGFSPDYMKYRKTDFFVLGQKIPAWYFRVILLN